MKLKRTKLPVRQRHGSDRQRGFTLIELLVVIAIIAVLAAMLMVSLAAAKSRVDKVVCMNNLHQFSVATALYVEDLHVYLCTTFKLKALTGSGYPATRI